MVVSAGSSTWRQSLRSRPGLALLYSTTPSEFSQRQISACAGACESAMQAAASATAGIRFISKAIMLASSCCEQKRHPRLPARAAPPGAFVFRGGRTTKKGCRFGTPFVPKAPGRAERIVHGELAGMRGHAEPRDLAHLQADVGIDQRIAENASPREELAVAIERLERLVQRTGDGRDLLALFGRQ